MTKKYRPSNSTEGDIFIAEWCNQCEKNKTPGCECQILADTFIFQENDPAYPEEWIYSKQGNPCCTAFIPAGTVLTVRCDKTIDMFQE
ncbi:MAG: hypothetical protein OEX07_14890 [Gammaproteobacteria bacterium]|nr:hypothetical protein [Gammaproteobacteria bacterium]